MSRIAQRLYDQVGPLALAGLALLAAGVLFFLLVLRPQEQELERLDAELARTAPLRSQGGARSAGLQAKVAAFYQFFQRDEQTVDWLAKIYAGAEASGFGLRNAEHRLVETRFGLRRYQVIFPVAGSYAQIRGFLDRMLEEIPLLSLDQVSFRRQRAGDARIEAEIVLTLHLPKP